MRIKIPFFLCMLGLLLGVLCTVQVKASENRESVYDYADLLTNEEEKELQLFAKKYEAENLAVIFLTIDDANGYSAMTYSDDFYDSHGFGADGVLFMIDMDNREVYINTVGKCIGWLAEDMDAILDATYTYAGDGNYYECLKETAKRAMRIVEGEQNPVLALMQYTGTLAVISGVITAIVLIWMLVSHHSANGAIHASRYLGNRFRVLNRKEHFLGCRDVVFHDYYRETTSSSGGGSGGSHRSSSGISHGGGGRKF